MKETLEQTIEKEVRSHAQGVRDVHIQVITAEISRQLRELFPESQLEILANNLSGQFKALVDVLIPIIEDYEEKIDAEISIQVSKMLEGLKNK